MCLFHFSLEVFLVVLLHVGHVFRVRVVHNRTLQCTRSYFNIVCLAYRGQRGYVSQLLSIWFSLEYLDLFYFWLFLEFLSADRLTLEEKCVLLRMFDAGSVYKLI